MSRINQEYIKKISGGNIMSITPIGYVIDKYRKILFPGHGGKKKMLDALDVSRQTLHDWGTGATSPNNDNLEVIAKVIGVDSKGLQKELEEAKAVIAKEPPPVEPPPVAPPEEFRLAYIGSNDEISIPTPGGAAAETNGQDSFYVDEADDPLVIPKGVCCVRIRGDSMAPIALDKQRVFLRPAGNTPVKGDLVVAWTNEDGIFQSYFKRWDGWRKTKDGGEELVLKSQNKREGVKNEVVIPREIYDDVRIVSGVWFG
jgi:phage repressor protein C with HTH and peptisase S24 domain